MAKLNELKADITIAAIDLACYLTIEGGGYHSIRAQNYRKDLIAKVETAKTAGLTAQQAGEAVRKGRIFVRTHKM